jgi:hypothetical protein
MHTDIGFQFDVIYKAEDLIQVRVFGWNGAFGGTAEIYVGIGLLEEIAGKLSGFPTRKSDSREFTLGGFGAKWAGGGVAMRFYCLDASGHACVESRIEAENLPSQSVQSATFSLPIEAAAVDSFVHELRRVGADRSGTAHLHGLPVSGCSQT